MINNEFYNTLHDNWYSACNHPVALLRAENALRIPWITQEIQDRYPGCGTILDIGCRAGFLTNALAIKNYAVTGIDLSEASLEVARKKDSTQKVQYFQADAYALPFADESFDVVCAMDILEHVYEPEKLISEASRVLRPNGIFLFHTFNRNWFSYLIAIKGVEWFVKNAPKNMHIYELFMRPKEVKAICCKFQLNIQYFTGSMPNIWTQAFWKMILTQVVPHNFEFKFAKSCALGYSGLAIKN